MRALSRAFDIAGRWVGEGHPAFIIAEAGANHNGDLALAKDMCRVARDLGCDCIKFQTFTAEEFCADPNQLFTYRSRGVEVVEPMIDLFRRLEFSRAQWAELMAHCDALGILFLTTVQDVSNLDMMLELGLKGIKVGSDDFDHLPNLRRYAATGLPLILSKGMAALDEVDRVIGAISPMTEKLAVLHCVSLYPAAPETLNIRQIATLKARYPDLVWGFSDHSVGALASSVAVALGAKVIEKHFTLDHDLPGPDHWFSMDVDQMKALVESVRFVEAALGSGEVAPAKGEEDYKPLARRRVVAARDLPAGARLDDGSVAFKRSSQGAFVSDWERLEGRRLKRAVAKNGGIDAADVDLAAGPS